MSGAPTSGADPRALLAAGWSEADLDWERRQEQAAEEDRAGARAEATRLWAEALQLARESFARNDPRLATSLANHAVALRRTGKQEAAQRLFEEALIVWDSSGPWIDALRPDRHARSSTFHLRLEAKHPGGYARHSRARYRELAVEGRAAVLALRDGRKRETDRLARWYRDRPEGFTDSRKLIAAVLLTAPVELAGGLSKA